MAFSRRGFHTLSDQISRDMWGISNLETVSGDGAISLVSNPDTGDARGDVMRFSSANAGGSAYFQLNIEFQPHNKATDNRNNLIRNITEGWFRFRLYWASPTPAGSEGSARILSLWPEGVSAADNEAVIVGTEAVDGNNYRFYVESRQGGTLTALGTTRDIPFDTWVDVILHAAGSGTVDLYTMTPSEDDYTFEPITDHPALTNFGSFRFGIYDLGWGAATNANLYLDDFAVSRSSIDEVKGHRYLAGSGIRDMNQTEAAAVLHYPDNLMQGATHARVVWDTEAAFANPSASAWNALSGTTNHCTGWTISSLTANTKYYYRFEISTTNAPSGIVFTSDTYEFWTPPTVGSNQEVLFGYGSCITQIACLSDTKEVGELRKNIEVLNVPYLGFYFWGDFGYEANGHVDLEIDYGSGAGNPPESQDEFEQVIREQFHNIDIYDLSRIGLFNSTPDDHQWINDGDGRHAPGGSLQNTLANNWASEQSNNGYSATVTLSDLYTAGLTVYDNWFNSWWLDTTVNSDRYQLKKFGKIYILIVDTRTVRNPDTPTYIGTTQKTWMKARIDEFADDANAETLIIMCQDAWSENPTKGSEGWERVAPTEYEELVDYIYDSAGTGGTGVSATKQVMTLVGDDHVGWVFHTDIDTPTHTGECVAPWVGELKFSGISEAYLWNGSSLMSNLGAKDKWSMTPLGSTYTTRTSGGLMRWANDASGMTAKVWEDDEAGGSTPNEYTVFGSAQSFDADLISSQSIESGAEFGSPTALGTGPQTVPIDGFANTTFFGSATVSEEAALISTIGIRSDEEFGNPTVIGPPVFPRDWEYYVDLTIPAAQVANTTQTDFLVPIHRIHLPDDIVDPSNANAAQVTGADLRASTDAAGLNQIPIHVVQFEQDSTTGAGDAVVEIYVKMDLSAVTDNVLYLHWKTNDVSLDAEFDGVNDPYGQYAVYGSFFEAVYHFDPTDDFSVADGVKDATSTQHNLDSIGSMTSADLIDANNGTAVDFDGTDDGLLDPSGTPLSMQGSGDKGISLLTRGPTSANLRTWVSIGDENATGNAGARFEFRPDQSVSPEAARLEVNAGFKTGSGDVSDNAWHSVSAQFNGSTTLDIEVYRDGVAGNSASGSQNINTGALAWRIGHNYNSGISTPERFFDGEMDEIRFYNVARSADWVETEHNSLIGAASFITTGNVLQHIEPSSIASEETVGSASLSVGAVDIGPSAIASEEAVGTALVEDDGTVTLAGDSITLGAWSIDNPTAAETGPDALTADSITLGAWAIDTPSIAGPGTDGLTADSITLGAWSIDSPTAGPDELAADSITLGSWAIDSPAIGGAGTDALSANSITLGAWVLDTPVLGEPLPPGTDLWAVDLSAYSGNQAGAVLSRILQALEALPGTSAIADAVWTYTRD